MIKRISAVILLACLVAASAHADGPGPFYIRQLQERLLLHGYDPGPANGEMTNRTRWAMAAYRRDAQLPPDTDSLDVLTHLRFAAPRVMAEPRPDGKGASPQVAAVQLMLRKLGYLSEPVDGRLGDVTEAAIAAYRQDYAVPGTEIDQNLLSSLTELAEQRGFKIPPVIAALGEEHG